MGQRRHNNQRHHLLSQSQEVQKGEVDLKASSRSNTTYQKSNLFKKHSGKIAKSCVDDKENVCDNVSKSGSCYVSQKGETGDFSSRFVGSRFICNNALENVIIDDPRDNYHSVIIEQQDEEPYSNIKKNSQSLV